jgi:Protein of unknown function (DUF742)
VPDAGGIDWSVADGRYPPGQKGRPPGPGSQPSVIKPPGPRDHNWRSNPDAWRSNPDSHATPGGTSSLVRPYTVTGGRTKPRYQLQIEAMVAASHYEARDLSILSPECQSILGFCRDWRSVAEISAVLRMPLGVVRVLIADMAMDGLVRVHQLDHAHGRPDLNLLERVLSGLRKL